MTQLVVNLTENKSPLLFVGLGNPGDKYLDTRHNAGFLFIDYLIERLDAKGFTAQHSKNSSYEIWKYPDLNISLLKPTTFMNLSGQAVRDFYRYHSKFSSKGLIVVHDDLDLALGDFKISIGKGPRTHNGLKSIEQEIAISDFIRLRLGIENRNGKTISGLDYVLYKFEAAELAVLQENFKKIVATRFII